MEEKKLWGQAPPIRGPQKVPRRRGIPTFWGEGGGNEINEVRYGERSNEVYSDVVELRGIEPLTSAMRMPRSSHLSYNPVVEHKGLLRFAS